MSETATIHASCVAIAGRGILLLGPSGAGKSDLAMRLIDRGAELVSDDYCDLRAGSGRLLASPPATIAGRIELRGVGILMRPYRARVVIALALDLAAPSERLPEPMFRTWLDVAIPTLGLMALEASAPMKVEAALASWGLTFPCLP